MDPGVYVRQARRRHRLSQERLARRAGISRASLGRIERGDVSPTVATLESLLLVMGERLQFTGKRLGDGSRLRRSVLPLTAVERLERALVANAMAAAFPGRGRSGSRDELQ